MKLSCLPVSLYADIFSGKKSVVDWIHFAAALGLDGVDFSIKFFPTREAQVLDTIRDEAQRAGITLCMLACYSDFTYPDHEQRRQEIEQMKADRLAGLVDTLLGSGWPPNKQRLNVHELLEYVVRLIQAESGNQINIRRDYDRGLPAMDLDQLVQALLNLVRNAVTALRLASNNQRCSGSSPDLKCRPTATK